MLLLYAAPVIYALYLSFMKWNFSATTQPVWQGLTNYGDVLTNDRFWSALFNTLYYAALVLGCADSAGHGDCPRLQHEFSGAWRLAHRFPVSNDGYTARRHVGVASDARS